MHSRDVRRLHALRVFYQLLVSPGLSQRDLAAMTGYDKSTISLIVTRLERSGILERRAVKVGSSRGRPVDQLHISVAGDLLVGVHLEDNSLKLVATSLGGHLRTIVDAELPEPAQIGEAIRRGIDNICQATGEPLSAVRGIGMAVPGQVDSEGNLLYSPNLGWKDVPLRSLVEEAIDTPVYIDNDVKTDALAEYFFGAARGKDSFLLVDGGVGVGGALFIDGDVFRGFGGFAGEVGHTKVVPGGRRCHCGADGCLAAYLTKGALFERVSELGGRVTTIATLSARAAANEPMVTQVLAEAGMLLGVAIANLVNTFNPPVVIFGGTISLLWQWLEPAFTKSFRASCLEAPLSQVTVIVHEPGAGDFPKGGISLALHELTSVVGTSTGILSGPTGSD